MQTGFEQSKAGVAPWVWDSGSGFCPVWGPKCADGSTRREQYRAGPKGANPMCSRNHTLSVDPAPATVPALDLD
jgi:hypothetical protein